MGLTFPRSVFMEMFLNAWTPVTTSMRQTSPVTITRGRGNEQGKVAPSKLTAVMHNSTGDFSPGNPKGVYYGLLGRNTPVRFGLIYATDDFNDTVVNGWGNLDTGETWVTTTGAGGTIAASDWQKDGNSGNHSVPVANGYRLSWVDGDYRDLEVAATTRVDVDPVNGGDIELANVMLRKTDGGATASYYFARCVVASTQMVRISILHHDGASGVDTVLVGPVNVPEAIQSAGHKTLRVKCQAEAQTLRAKVWIPNGNNEPYAWHVAVHDERLTAGGGFGIRSSVASGNTNTKPIVFQNTDFQVREVRLAGEISDLRPRWDVTHKIKWVEMEAAGILRRLTQGKPPATSAIERFVVSNAIQPLAFWPLDDGELSAVGRVAAGSQAYEASGVVTFGAARVATWLNPVVAIQQDRGLVCRRSTVHTGSYTVHLMFSYVGGNYSSATYVDRLFIGLHEGAAWIITIDSFTGKISLADPLTFVTALDVFPAVFDTKVHHLAFRSTQSGADVIWTLYIDGESVGSGTKTGFTSSIDKVLFQLDADLSSDSTRVRSACNVIMYDGAGPAVSDVYDAMFGHVGDKAGRRIERVCTQAGIPFDYVGSLDDTAPMGPQRTLSTEGVLRECEDADRGTLYEPRSVAGLAYRTLGSLYNQAHQAVLDYSAGHVAPPLHPTGDDKETRNKITVKRQDGGQAEAVQESGPLNVNDPGTDPDGVGVYDVSVTVNSESDDQLPYIAGHLLRIGTTDEDRYPKVHVNLAAPNVDGNAEKELSVMAVNIDDRLAIDNLTAADIYGSVDQLARGYTEVIKTAHDHDITFNTAPSAPYTAFTLDSDRPDSNTSTLAAGVNTSATSLSVATTQEGSAPLTLWTTDAADFPFTIEVGGEVMTVTAISGSSSPQTFTVTRNVNSLPGGKSHSAGAQVRLAIDAALALQGQG
ncbi:MAG TPA: hypothetical protein VGX25_04785 [Actinophytocola sp.]|uniref:hypothetical protein n=1 Tax=Actinophytocola sp. TaxID=1872138 RepID=UPI002DDDB35E|nr:hypothetical protein [Actinophytocola sp.]HEV2778698.1 hypothetical protein [Actinophytocola sp.]